ncbi:MAG: ABC transporter ATP-binding protein [Candidatus Omnitrophota bacterium]
MLLEVKDLKVYFDNDNGETVKAVDGISFGVGEDEVVGIVGESGSGKTMTALSVMRLIPPTGRFAGGEILFSGRDLLKLDEESMRQARGQSISMIFQEPFTSLNPVFMIGDQIVESVLAHKQVPAQEAKDLAVELLKKVQMKDPDTVYHKYPHQLSGGQRQRVMIAMALALGPKLLIADEPTTALDVTIQAEILALIAKLKRELNMSIIFITHDLGVVNAVADRIFVMKDGKIVESGAKRDIMKAPKHPYTKKLLDAIPKIETDKGADHIERGDFVKVESLCKTYSIERGIWRKKVGQVKALDGVTLEIKRGGTLGLVGESASGKSTLGRLILGLEEPDSGRITIDGKPLAQHLKETPRKIREMMQIVFQDPYGSLDPRMRMGDIVVEGPSILGYKKARRERMLEDTLNKVNLKYKDRSKYPHQFSGGERQRIAIARALAVNPKFLVLDEPVSSLDVSIQAGILDLLKELQNMLKLTYLFISHDLRVVGHLANEVAVMHEGRIVEAGPKSSVYTSPKHDYTKRLLSSIPKL